MRVFYAEAGLDLDEARAADAFTALLADRRYGRAWLIEQDGEAAADEAAASPDEPPAAGYVVVTFVFAMEYGGTVAVVDDLYVRPQARGEGLGTAALAAVRRTCEELGVLALRVEVGEDNAPARRAYAKAGFTPLEGHALMALPLVPPLNER